MNNKRLLFGGALLAAGLAVQSAEADFVSSFNYSLVGAYSYGVGGTNYTIGAGPWSVSAAEPGALGTSDGTDKTVNLHAYSDPIGRAFSWLVFSYFTVSYAATANLSWDFVANGYGFGYVTLFNVTGAYTMLFIDSGSGSQTVDLELGVEYRMSGLVFVSDQDGAEGEMSVDFVVPTPGSLPLLAAGGLCVSRRRRRRK